MANRILRSSMYRDAYDRTPATAVIRESDLRCSIEEACEMMPMPGVFVVNDVFEVDAQTYADPVRASFAGIHRLDDSTRRQEELHMALAYYWNANALKRVTNGGVVAATKEAPLSEEQLTMVLRQLGKHPNYEGQKVIQISKLGKTVTLERDGKTVTVYP